MIVIRIEMWPGGREEGKREIALAHIANIGGNGTVATYSCKFLKSAEYSARNAGKVWRQGRVTDFNRKKLGPWDLLLRALVAVVGSRNPNAVTQLAGNEFGDEPMECL